MKIFTMKYVYVFALTLALAASLAKVHAQSPAKPAASSPPAATAPSAARVYRCGNQYTNAPTDAQAKDCKLLEPVPLTVVEAVRPAPGRKAGPASGPAASAVRVDSSEQRARDADARAILEAELSKAQARQTELLREYNNGEPEKLGPETRNYQKYLDRVAHLKASIARNEVDIEGLRRELSRLTASK
jgi:hypothetical protein